MPHPALREYVSEYNLLRQDEAVEVDAIPPQISSGFAFFWGKGKVIHQGTMDALPDSYIIPVNESCFKISSEKGAEVLAVKFWPGKFYEFFGFPQHLFIDSTISLTDLPQGKHFKFLYEQISEAEQVGSQITLIDDFLLKNYPKQPIFRPAMTEVLKNIYKGHWKPNKENLLPGINISDRHLRREFKNYTGLNLRSFIKIYRFYYAFYQLLSGAFTSLTELALDSGYFDQAHFIREFKKYAGMSPRTFLKQHSKLVEALAWEGKTHSA